jgi:hypothetical protein
VASLFTQRWLPWSLLALVLGIWTGTEMKPVPTKTYPESLWPADMKPITMQEAALLPEFSNVLVEFWVGSARHLGPDDGSILYEGSFPHHTGEAHLSFTQNPQAYIDCKVATKGMVVSLGQEKVIQGYFIRIVEEPSS